MTVAVVGALALWALAWGQQQQLREAERSTALAEGRLTAKDQVHGTWNALAALQLDRDAGRVRASSSIGDARHLAAELPPPLLVAAFDGASAWWVGDDLCVAVPIAPGRLWYGERHARGIPLAGTLLLGCGALLLAGLALGLYLVRRIYVPVRDLVHEATAALAGHGPGRPHVSQETSALAAPVSALIDAYRSSSGQAAIDRSPPCPPCPPRTDERA